MVKEVIICDICGKEIEYAEASKMYRFQTKLNYIPSKWVYKDIHDKCFKLMVEYIKDHAEE